MNRAIDFQTLRMENFQLKNQITDLKNGFDLNKDILKILSEQTKNAHPKLQIFYQIISRLTGINNQIMLTNVQLLQQKNKLIAENRKLQNTIDNLSSKIQQLVNSKDCFNPKQFHIEMRNQMKDLRSEILSLNEDCLRKNMMINHLQNTIKQMQNQNLKKPIIPSIMKPQLKVMNQITEINKVPKKYESQGTAKDQVIKKNLQRQNCHLKRLVQELQYRLTLLSSLYEQQSPNSGREKDYDSDYKQSSQNNYRKINEQQLSLLIFALNNTQLEQDQQNQGLKLTITKRCNFLNNNKKSSVHKSCIF